MDTYFVQLIQQKNPKQQQQKTTKEQANNFAALIQACV